MQTKVMGTNIRKKVSIHTNATATHKKKKKMQVFGQFCQHKTNIEIKQRSIFFLGHAAT